MSRGKGWCKMSPREKRMATTRWERQMLKKWARQGRLRLDGTLKTDPDFNRRLDGLSPQELRAIYR